MVNQLVNCIYHYLIGDRSLEDLETWLLSNLQEILDSHDETAIELANKVDVDLVELGEGLIDQAILSERLESYLTLRETKFVFSETGDIAIVSATADVQTLKNRLEVPGPVVDFRLSHVFA